ncbi:hypothetical protein Pcinc_006319 [Petrolisthes cinctipes]|uniref:Uncharacterized protein n=1 Tax=Petrolisthes cinctipes TaxID=88211 RepID=A0AAE1GBR4_PETCI|nr:hypothetical protein Pcinc_006319 [Petrolisthes cinctipes]
MTYDPLRCMTCKAFIAESENGVAAMKAVLRKLFIAIRCHQQRSNCPCANLMNFFSSKEEANRLLNLAHYIPSSPRAHNSLSQLTSPSHSKASLQPHCIEQQPSLTALPSTSLQEPSRGADTITMKDSEPATKADALCHALTSILPHPAPEPLAEEQSSTPRGDSATPAATPAKKQRQDATLNDISSLLLQFAQRFDKLESDMAILKGSNSQLQQDCTNLKKGKRNLPYSSSSSSEDEANDPPPAAQPARSLPSQRSPSPPPYSPAIPVEPDSSPDPAAITYYAPPGASFIFKNDSEILIFWVGAGYGKFICVSYNQRAFKLAFPRQLEIFTTFLDLCSTSPQVVADQELRILQEVITLSFMRIQGESPHERTKRPPTAFFRRPSTPF